MCIVLYRSVYEKKPKKQNRLVSKSVLIYSSASKDQTIIGNNITNSYARKESIFKNRS